MKLCKIEIIKQISENDTRCTNVYPDGYDASIMDVFCYGDADWTDGDNVSYALARVPDDFIFTSKMTLISKKDATVCIEDTAEYIELKVTQTQDINAGLDAKDKYLKRKSYLV